MKEKVNWYTTEVLRTWDTSLSKRERILHALTGLVGEVTEFFQNDRSDDEAGDILFYFYALDHELGLESIDEQGWKIADLFEFRHNSENRLHRYLGRVAELAKKQQFHDKDISDEISHRMIELSVGLMSCFRSPIEEIKQLNKAKLRKRYPEGFSLKKCCEDCGGEIAERYESNKCISCDHGKVSEVTK